MSIRLEKILVLFVTLFVCALILAWSFFLNFGKLEIVSNQPFEIHGLGKQILVCETSTCLQKAPIGEFNVSFLADGFKPIEAQLEIRRWQTTKASFEFEYEPVLVESELSEQIDLPPEVPFQINSNIIAWDKYEQNLAYLNQKDSLSELMLWNKPAQEFIKITNFYNFGSPQIYWGGTGENLIVRDLDNFYFVDLQKKLKYKMNFSTFDPEIKLSPDDKKLLYTKNGQVWIYQISSKESAGLSGFLILENLIWKNNLVLFYFQNDEESTSFFEYDLETQTSKLLFQSILLSPKKLKVSSNGNDLEFQTDSKNYQLRFSQ